MLVDSVVGEEEGEEEEEGFLLPLVRKPLLPMPPPQPLLPLLAGRH